jgi:hypothetical protein
MHTRLPRLALNSFIIFCLSFILMACGTMSLPQDYRPVEFTTEPSPYGENIFPNWSAPPLVVEGALSDAISSGEIPERVDPNMAQRTAHGISGPNEVVVLFPKLEKEVKFKWKVAPSGDLDNYNNSIAREVASYQIQKLFLESEDYVVPTSLAFCITYKHHTKHMGIEVSPQIEGSECVIGNASLWLVNVKVPEVLYDESRFLSEPDYAYHLSNFNILTYLVAHRDTRSANVLVSEDDQRHHLFSIDNGTTFGAFPYNFFVPNWNIIRVPALRKETIDRLRKVKREDLDYLGVVVQLNKDNDRVFRNVVPGENLDPEIPVRIRVGMVQFGLTKQQIDDVWVRIQTLIERVDSGDIPTF